MEFYVKSVEAIFNFFMENGYSIYLLKNYLKNQPPLNYQELNWQYSMGDEYFFIAVYNQ